MAGEASENDAFSSRQEKRMNMKHQVLTTLFGHSTGLALPVLNENRTSSKNAPRNADPSFGNAAAMQRRSSSFRSISGMVLADLRENTAIPAAKEHPSGRRSMEGRKCRMRADSETMTADEEEEMLRAFTKSRRAATRRRTSASRGSRTGGDGYGDGDAPPPSRMLTRRRSTRFDLAGISDDDAGGVGSSSSLFGRRGSTTGRMSDWRRISLLIKQQEELREMEMRKQAREKFIHAAKLVIILHRVYRIIFRAKKQAEKIQPVSFTSLAEEYQSDNMKMSGLSFDRNYFKVKKEIGITPEVRNILSTPSYARSKEQLGTALVGLQTMKSFAEYPLHMQEKLVKVAWFEFIPSQRVIIRQGHYAENFYFVISGSVVVTILSSNPDTGETSMRTVAVLRRGSSFGEIAILHHGRRTATVSSQGPVQLLAITREDFFDIFMRGQEPGQEPEHVSFLRQISVFKYWPFEELLQHPEMCLFHFYKRGQVIVKDSNNSDWIYVVKSGTCQVLMQLKAVRPHIHPGKDRSPEGSVVNSRVASRTQSDTQWKTSRKQWKQKTLSLPDIEPLQLSAPRKSILDHRRSVSVHHMELRSLSDSPTFLTRSKALSESDEEDALDNDHLSSHGITPVPNHHATSSSMLPTIDLRKGATLSHQSFSPSSFQNFSSIKRSSSMSSSSSSSHSRTRSHSHHGKKMKSAPAPEIHVSRAQARTRRASIPTDRKGVSVFIQVELLQPKDSFGISSLDLDLGFDHAQSSVSLVSRGAECIMIRKDFFVKHATNAVKRNVRSLVYPYPTEQKLQENLQSHSDWSQFKNDTLSGILSDKDSSKGVTT